MNGYSKKETVLKHIEEDNAFDYHKILNPNFFEDEEIALAYYKRAPSRSVMYNGLKKFIEYGEYFLQRCEQNKSQIQNSLRKNKNFVLKLIETAKTFEEDDYRRNYLFLSIYGLYDKSTWNNQETLAFMCSINYENFVNLYRESKYDKEIVITPKIEESAIAYVLNAKKPVAISNIADGIDCLSNENKLRLYRAGVPEIIYDMDYSLVEENDMLESLENDKNYSQERTSWSANIILRYFEKTKKDPSSKEVVLKCIKELEDRWIDQILKYVPKEFTDDIDFCKECCRLKPSLYKYMPQKIKANKEIALEVIQKGYADPLIFCIKSIYPHATFSMFKTYIESADSISLNKVIDYINTTQSRLAEKEILELCKIAVKKDPANIEGVPKDILLKAFSLYISM